MFSAFFLENPCFRANFLTNSCSKPHKFESIALNNGNYIEFAPANVGTRRVAFFPHFVLKAAKPSDWSKNRSENSKAERLEQESLTT